ncbi:MAG: hypothetical protein Q9221_006493 [Calogaya cf. arnoldii]
MSRVLSRAISTSAVKAVEQWLGYPLQSLTPKWKEPVVKFTSSGGAAEVQLGLGKITSVEIKSRDEGPVHTSHYNPKDLAEIISIRVVAEHGTVTCHVYEDGTGTTKMGGERA